MQEGFAPRGVPAPIGASVLGTTVKETATNREPQVLLALLKLEESISVVSDKIGKLQERLSPVLREPHPCQPTGEEGLPQLVPVADKIRCEANKAEFMAERVDMILDRLEL